MIKISQVANNDLAAALASGPDKIVIIDTEDPILLNSTLNRKLLYDASIIGMGFRSVIRVIGNINPFDLQGTQNFMIKDVKIEMHKDNENDVFKLTGNGQGECINNTISCKITTIPVPIANNDLEYPQGKFTGVRLISETSGIHHNNINVSISNCKDGIILEGKIPEDITPIPAPWVTHNRFYGCHIEHFTGTAFDIIERPNTSIINNIISDLRIIDRSKMDIEKTGIRLTGMANVFSNLQIFNDSKMVGTFYWLDLSAPGMRSYNNSFIGGGVEGLIKEEKNMIDHYFNLNIVKRAYSPSTFDSTHTPIRYAKSFICNILANNFDRFEHYVGQHCQLEKIGSTVKLTLTEQYGKFYINLPEPAKYYGKYITVTMKVKSKATVFPIIINSEDSVMHGTPNNATNPEEYQIISVSKKVDNNTLTQVGMIFEKDTALGAIAEIEWMVVNEGRLSPNEKVPNIPYQAKGNVTINSAATQVVVNHGLPFAIPLENIRVSPTNNLGLAKKWWISQSTEGKFYISVDAAPGTELAKFAWNIEY